MKEIGLVLPYDYSLFSVATILDVLATANRMSVEKKKETPFRITIFQSTEQIEQHGRSFHGYPVRSIRSGREMDIVLIPAFTTQCIKDTLERNKPFIPWLQKQFKAGVEMASFCTGAYLFASAGLLNGRLATTHTNDCPNFIVAYPSVFVKPGRTLTIDGRCYTSGNTTSVFHLLIFLIQKYAGNELAVRVAKFFAVDLDRYQQSYFSTFRPNYSHNDELVKKIQRYLEANYYTINTIEEVIRDMPASRRNLVRRFKKVTGIPPIEYLQHIRIEKAKGKLEHTDLSISEIIPVTGYTDPKSFRKIFLKLVGISPLEYRSKFNIK
jgi:transcriptional regulator GlxA family with amidase domain